METFDLIAHPAHPPTGVRKVTARVLSYDANWCVLRWKVEGAAGVIMPAFAGAARADGLWQTTCFELFVRRLITPVSAASSTTLSPRGEGVGPGAGAGVGVGAATYSEFNFSPSERWAAYDFAGYRAGMTDRAMDRAPVITPRRGGDVLFCDVAIPAAQLPPQPWRYALTAVIEEADGVKSFWAPAHGGPQPDFHDPACLTATFAAPDAA